MISRRRFGGNVIRSDAAILNTEVGAREADMTRKDVC